MSTTRIKLAMGVGLIILTIVGGAAWLANEQSILAKQTAEQPNQPLSPARQARVVHPEPVNSQGELSLIGRTAPVEQALVASRANGFVAERFVDIGDKVKAGDLLLVVDAPEVAQELARSQAAVEQVKARLELAKLNFERAQSLVTKGHVSEQLRDERQATERTTIADLAAAEAEVRRLEDLQSFQRVKAPFDGTIVSRQVDRGDRISTNDNQSGNALFRIARLNELRVEIDVPQSYALKVRTGTQARVTFNELPGEVFDARVVRSAGLIDPSSATMRAELIMPNPGERIPAGLNGQVKLHISGALEVVSVPANTLVIRDGQQRVATTDADGKVSFRAINLGRDLGERVEVVTGLTQKDRVILSPNALLREGDKVDVTMATAAKKASTQTK